MKQSIATDAVKLTIAKSVTLIISLASVMLLSRFRTLEEYGTYSQLLMVVNMITTIFLLGLPNSINYFLARAEDEEQKQKFLSTYYTLSTALSLVTGLVLVLSAPIIASYFGNALIKNFIYFLAIYPWTKIVLAGIDNILIIYNRTWSIAIFRILNSACLLSIIVIVEIFGWGFNTYMLLFVCVEAVFAASVYFIARSLAGNLQFDFDTKLIAKILKFSVPLGLASVVGTLNILLDKLIIGHFFDTEQLAIYTNASNELPVTIIAASVTAVLMPQLVRLFKQDKKEEAISLWGDATLLSYIVICFLATGVFVFAPEVISLLYSEKYLPGVPVFRIYSLVLLLRCTYFGMVLNSTGNTKFIFYSSIAALCINTILAYVLLLVFGFIGPAIAAFTSQAIIQYAQLHATSKVTKISFNRIFPWRALSYITFVNISMGVVFYFVKGVLPLELFVGEIVESVLLGVVWGLIYILIMCNSIKLKWAVLNGQSV